MRKPWLLLALLLPAALPALADGGPEQAAVAGDVASAQARLRQQVRNHDAAVAQLERAVLAQESRSRRAHDRLRDQDREIARLQRQLEALRGNRQESDPGR